MKKYAAAFAVFIPLAVNAAEENPFDQIEYGMTGMFGGAMTYHASNCQFEPEKKTFAEIKAKLIELTLKNEETTAKQREIFQTGFEKGVAKAKAAKLNYTPQKCEELLGKMGR